MSRVILAFVMLLFTIFSAVLSLFATNKICSDMIASVDEVIDSLSSDNTDIAQKTATLTKKWDKSVKPLTLFTGQKNTAEITSLLQSISFFIEKGNKEAAILSCQECKQLLLNMVIINKPSLLSFADTEKSTKTEGYI